MVTGMTSVQTLVSQDIVVVFNDTFSSLINSMVNTEIFSHVSYKTTTTTTTNVNIGLEIITESSSGVCIFRIKLCGGQVNICK